MNEQTEGAERRVYSEWLGTIAPQQFQSALSRFDLGDFLEATPVAAGLGGQNVFVSSTKGKYVLRGRPIYPWQFPKECFGVTLLHDRTHVPVAFPYSLDSSTDIFGWPYVLMPRLSGVSPHDDRLTVGEQVWVARAVGRNLAQMHEITWAFAGEYDIASNTIQPFAQGYAQWFVDDSRRWLGLCEEQGFITADDVIWAEQVISEAKSALTVPFRPCFVMGDYHPGNVLVTCEDGEWRVSGLFDFMDYFFGDGEADLTRATAAFLDLEKHQDTRLARAFGAAYLESRPARPGFAERYGLSMLRDRLQVWEFAHRLGQSFLFPKGWSFRQYAKRYVATCRLFEQHVR
jgi:aminoglycoside phosphotransferase (APT) family kinase protein